MLSHVNLLIGSGSSCSHALLAKRPSSIFASATNCNSNVSLPAASRLAVVDEGALDKPVTRDETILNCERNVLGRSVSASLQLGSGQDAEVISPRRQPASMGVFASAKPNEPQDNPAGLRAKSTKMAPDPFSKRPH